MSRELRRLMTHAGTRQVTRRGVLKGAAGIGAAAAGSAVFAVPSVIGQAKSPVSFWTTHSDSGFEALSLIADNFNAQNETYEVTISQVPPAEVSDSTSLITALRAGEGPDVYLLDRFIVAERAAQGILEDLTPFIEAEGGNPDLKEAYVDFAAAEATYNGAPYAFPFDTDVRALFYNRTTFEKLGLDAAPFDASFETKVPLTLAQFEELVHPAFVDDGTAFTSAGFIPYFAQAWHYSWGFTFHGSFFDYENCVVTLDDPGVQAGFQWVYDYTQKYGPDKLYAFIQNAIRVGAAPTDSPFVQGNLATMINGNWMFANFRNYQPDDDIGFTYIPVPAEGDSSATWAGGWSGVVPKEAKNPEGGYQFVKYLTGPEGSRTYVEINNNLPVLRELLTDASLFTEELKWFVDELFPTTFNRPPLPVGALLWDELGAAFEATYLGTSTPQDALAIAQENVQFVIDSEGYCPIS